MNKTMKSYRIDNLYLDMVSELSRKAGLSQTDVVELAISNFYSMYFDTHGKVVDKAANDLVQALEFKRFMELKA